jgi:hypothetical protein
MKYIVIKKTTTMTTEIYEEEGISLDSAIANTQYNESIGSETTRKVDFEVIENKYGEKIRQTDIPRF